MSVTDGEKKEDYNTNLPTLGTTGTLRRKQLLRVFSWSVQLSSLNM